MYVCMYTPPAASSFAWVQHKRCSRQMVCELCCLNQVGVFLQCRWSVPAHWPGWFQLPKPAAQQCSLPPPSSMTDIYMYVLLKLKCSFIISVVHSKEKCISSVLCPWRIWHASSCGQRAITSGTCENRGLFIKIIYLYLLAISLCLESF